MTIISGTTSLALWHSIIQDAGKSCAIVLKEDVEAYLVFLLMRYIDKPELFKHTMAIDFLRGTKNATHLQAVGDKCLLLAGLFPAIAEKRHVKISYFVSIGQTAYTIISKKSNDLYDLLAGQFVPSMDILQAISHQATLTPLDAYDLWNETGSQRALSILRQYSRSKER